MILGMDWLTKYRPDLDWGAYTLIFNNVRVTGIPAGDLHHFPPSSRSLPKLFRPARRTRPDFASIFIDNPAMTRVFADEANNSRGGEFGSILHREGLITSLLCGDTFKSFVRHRFSPGRGSSQYGNQKLCRRLDQMLRGMLKVDAMTALSNFPARPLVDYCLSMKLPSFVRIRRSHSRSSRLINSWTKTWKTTSQRRRSSEYDVRFHLATSTTCLAQNSST